MKRISRCGVSVKKEINPLLLLWPLVLIKKEFALIAIFLLIVFSKPKKYVFNKTSFPMLLVGAIQLVSIGLSCLQNSVDFERVLAGINTSFVWIFSSFCYIIFFNSLNSKNVSLTAKFNIVILFCLTIFALIMYKKRLNISFMGRTLYNLDWSNNVESIRVNCFFEYTTLIPFFVLINIPFALSNIKKSKVKVLFILLISLIPIYFSKSRWGLFIYILFCILYLYNHFLKNKLSSNKKVLCSVVLIILLTSLYNPIIGKFRDIVLSRESSNNMRLLIYQKSISLTISQNFLFGCGIKHMIKGYPLGSHSSIIGAFYKTGLIGFIIFTYWYLSLFSTSLSKIKNNYIFSIPIIMILLFMVFEDIDGTNWMLFSYSFLLSNLKNDKQTNIFIDRGDHHGINKNLYSITQI